MQITDVVSQYHNSVSGKSDIEPGMKGVNQVSQTVQQLKPGQVFEGSIINRDGNQVTISLSSGQHIQARLDQGVSISQGQSVFFEVKSNQDQTIQIRALSADMSNNPTLLQALDVAKLPANERNLTMVNTMMQQQMPIDAKSLQTMSHALYANPTSDPATLVLMKKLDIPLTSQMVQQFENYKANEGAILHAVDDMLDAMPEIMSSENLSKEEIISFQKTFVTTLQLGDLSGSISTSEEMPADVLSDVSQDGVEALQTSEGEVRQPLMQTTGDISSENPDQVAVNRMTDGLTESVVEKGNQSSMEVASKESQGTEVTLHQTAVQGVMDMEKETTVQMSKHASGAELTQNVEGNALETRVEIVTDEKLPSSSIADALQSVLGTELSEPLPTTGKAMLELVLNTVSSNPNISKETVLKLLDSEPYKALWKQIMEESWTIRPEELGEEQKIQQLYEKLEVHMKQLEETAKQLTGNEHNPFTKVTQNVQSNIEFMNQVNHLFSYVQIPLKFANQSATGDLYVYSNKRNAKEDSDELSAFLHFDLQHLGSTDIAVKLKAKKVDTQFFMEDDASYQLVLNHIEILQEKLEKKGYDATISVSVDQKPVNLITDFLEKEVQAGNGDQGIQRYSFDVKA